MTSVVILLALCQVPAPASPPKASAVGTSRPKVERSERSERSEQAKREAAALIARNRARRRAAYVARTNREAAEAQVRAAAQAKAEKQYREMLPFLLENQRQQLNRQTAIERNAALNRAVSAMEREAGYVYPGQSPTVGPYR